MTTQFRGRNASGGGGQPLDSDLTAIAAVTTTTYGRSLLALASAVALAGQVPAAALTYSQLQNVSATDKILGRSSSGAGVAEEITCTAAGRALIDDAAASNQRTTLGLGTAAVEDADTAATANKVVKRDANGDATNRRQILTDQIDFTSAATIRPTLNGAGVGKAITVGGGLGTGAASGATNIGTDGATPGTNPAGGVFMQGGTIDATLFNKGIRFLKGTAQFASLGVFSTNNVLRFGPGEVAGPATEGGRIEGTPLTLVGSSTVTMTIGGAGVGVAINSSYVDLSGQIGGAPHDYAFGASVTIELNNSNFHRVATMTGPIALTVTNAHGLVGMTHDFQFKQDATGGRVVTFPGTCLPSDIHALTVDTTANKRTILTFKCLTSGEYLLVNRQVFAS